MMISTKGRYALRVMIDLAEHNTGNYITLAEIATRQEISEKYLESIVNLLSKKGYVDALRGKGGGYRLNRAPEAYNIAEILSAADCSMAPVSCLETETNQCERAASCKTLGMWEGLHKLIRDYFKGISLADLVKSGNNGDFVI